MFITTNKKIATAPFATNQITTTTARGVALVDQAMRLTPLTVLYQSLEGVEPGTTVYVPGECMKHKWATDIYEHEDGTKFILVPQDLVCAVKFPEGK